jgi:hypothetical protein
VTQYIPLANCKALRRHRRRRPHGADSADCSVTCQTPGGASGFSPIVVTSATRGATRDAIPITGVVTADGSMQLRGLQELRTIA